MSNAPTYLIIQRIAKLKTEVEDIRATAARLRERNDTGPADDSLGELVSYLNTSAVLCDEVIALLGTEEVAK